MSDSEISEKPKRIKRTKIVATLGPASSSPEIIKKLILAGVNVFRLNFSHGNHEGHGEVIGRIKEIRRAMNRPVAILQDLAGPKIRIGKIKNPPLKLSTGEVLILDTTLSENDGSRIPVTYPDFPKDVRKGDRLLLADGEIELQILEVTPRAVECKIIVGGELSSNKGINYPGGSFNLPAVTDKDEQDLLFGLRMGVDYVALSFVRSVQDLERARRIIDSQKSNTGLIAKIEKHEAVTNFSDILQVVDGVMVARGDLGVEIPIEQVPLVQKKIIRMSNISGKPVITATQMLRSMVSSPRPTRAEVTDVANAILDGTDAIMLSEETATGEYPVQAVEMMSRIALYIEENYPYYHNALELQLSGKVSIPEAISHSASLLARDLNTRLIICPTTSGFTARMIARFRPRAHILALTPSKQAYHQLSLVWSVAPQLLPFEKHTDKLIQNSLLIAENEKLIERGDNYVITAGYPFGIGGSTNLIKVGVFEG